MSSRCSRPSLQQPSPSRHQEGLGCSTSSHTVTSPGSWDVRVVSRLVSAEQGSRRSSPGVARIFRRMKNRVQAGDGKKKPRSGLELCKTRLLAAGTWRNYTIAHSSSSTSSSTFGYHALPVSRCASANSGSLTTFPSGLWNQNPNQCKCFPGPIVLLQSCWVLF